MAKPVQKQVQLNEEQQAAVGAGIGYWKTLAGPGSGKTSVVVERYKRLRQSWPAEDILSLTFTREAAAEMRKRANAKDSTTRTCGFMTFHALSLAFCVQEHEHFPATLAAFPLATEGQVNKFLGEAARRHQVDFRELRSYISHQKRTRVVPGDAVHKADELRAFQKHALAYKQYEEKMAEAGLLDFDSLIVEMVNLLERSPELREKWSFRWIQVDESQDADELQWRLVQLLSDKYKNVFAVGDLAQCLYGFRGAQPELFQEMGKLFPGVKTLYLATNYRSDGWLVEFFRKIGPVKELADRFHTPNPAGEEPVFRNYVLPEFEATEIAKEIATRGGENTAVLSRTNWTLRLIEESLAEQGVRYHMLGRSGFWAQPEVKHALAYIQCAVAPYDSAVLGAIRAPFAPAKFLKKKQILEYIKGRQAGDPNKQSAWKLLHDYTATTDAGQVKAVSGFCQFVNRLTVYRDVPAATAVKMILKDLQAVEYYETEEESEPDNSPAENLAELARIAFRFDNLFTFLEHVRKVNNASRVKKGVAIGTCHAAKGREWDTVYLISVSQGILPHKSASNINEEQRIWFVGASRAARRLIVSYHGLPSEFIRPFLTIEPEPDPIESFFD